MSDTALTLTAAAIAIAVVNLLVSVLVMRHDGFTRGQAAAQCVIVWLVPVVGAAVVGTVLWTIVKPEKIRRATDAPGEVTGANLTDHGGPGVGHAP